MDHQPSILRDVVVFDDIFLEMRKYLCLKVSRLKVELSERNRIFTCFMIISLKFMHFITLPLFFI